MLVSAGNEDGLSWGGVTGGAGTEKAGVEPLAALAAASAAAPTSASRWNGEEGERRRVGRSMLDFAVFKGGSAWVSRCKSSGMNVDRRISDSLAMLPRLLRRNGMVSGGQGHDDHCLVTIWAFTASTHALLCAIAAAGMLVCRCWRLERCVADRVAVGVAVRSRGGGRTVRDDKDKVRRGER